MKILNEEQIKNGLSIFDLWRYACNGNTQRLKKYYAGGGIKNLRYKAFGTEHSLIAGAFRNRQHDTVEYLISIGETVMLTEAEEFRDYLDKFSKGDKNNVI